MSAALLRSASESMGFLRGIGPALLLHRAEVDNEARLMPAPAFARAADCSTVARNRGTPGPGMNVIQKPTQGAQIATGDLDRFRLRHFIESLAGTDELEQRDAPVDLADIAGVLDGNSRAVHFLAAGPEEQELVGNVMSSRSRIARAFGVAPERLAPEMGRRLANTPQIVEVGCTEAPVQQVVLAGEAADLTALPVHLQHGLDGAPYISASIDYTLDAKTGWTNVGIRRLMLRGRRETGVYLASRSDLRAL